IPDVGRRRWVQERMEAPIPPTLAARARQALDEALDAEVLEQVMQARYLGNKRFSIEGLAALVLLLREMLQGAARQSAVQVVLALSHTGRVNRVPHRVS